MSDNEIRMEIAKLCGWRKVYYRPSEIKTIAWLAGINPRPDRIVAVYDDVTLDKRDPVPADYEHPETLPAYPYSLDACREFEQLLNPEEQLRYESGLRRLCGARPFLLITAPPKMRCIEFLRVKGIVP